MTHCEYWDYTFNRWSKAEMSVDTIKQRFFCGPEEGNRIGFLRNAISRLWWFGYLTYQENSPAPYKLTKLMLSNSDLCQSIIERNFSMNKEISIGILSAIQEINDDPNMRDVGAVNNGDHYEWRPLCKYINRYGGVALLDTLTRDDIMQALGVKLETISHLVGHTTTRITQSRYLRVQNEACQDALDRFDERFGLAL